MTAASQLHRRSTPFALCTPAHKARLVNTGRTKKKQKKKQTENSWFYAVPERCKTVSQKQIFFSSGALGSVLAALQRSDKTWPESKRKHAATTAAAWKGKEKQ